MPVDTLNNFLAGDIGGTKTRLAVIEVNGSQAQIKREAEYPSRDYATFEALLGDFLSDIKSSPSPNSPPQAGERDAVSLRELHFNHAAFGVAGPVRGRVVQTTNLPWRIDADALQRQFGFAHCTLLNDLEATAYGLPALGADDLLTLQAGVPDAGGNAAVIAAGTGLGEAGLFWDGQHHHPFATEGGHASFSPGDELGIAFLRYLGETTDRTTSHLTNPAKNAGQVIGYSHSTKLQKTAAKSLVIQQQYQHVSWERVVSGMGLVSLHEFLRLHRHIAAPQWLAEEMRNGDAAAAIASAALSGRDEICVETLAWFVRLYGAEAGNLALKVMSHGGVYLGGGIAPKILPLLRNGTFIDAFLNKGRMSPLLKAMPIKVILNDRAALFGAALRAAQLANAAR